MSGGLVRSAHLWKPRWLQLLPSGDRLLPPVDQRPVARSAAELLTSGTLDRIRECASETCAWLFLDSSKNRSRRWCDMKVCGNRAKVRRFYRRHSAS